MVLHIKGQKHNDESEYRRSRLSSASVSSQEELTPSKELEEEIKSDEVMGLINVNPIAGMDFKRSKEASFQNTISLVSNLISELDSRARKVRAKKKVAVI